MPETRSPEPWLRGTLVDVPPVLRAVVHALQLAEEDLQRWCGDLSDEQENAHPFNLPSVAFHIRHIARSIDRLLTYAEGQELNSPQLQLLATENDPNGTGKVLFAELQEAIAVATKRIWQFSPEDLGKPRTVGRKRLPTTVAGLLVHVADHTQRHVGQAITTAKVIKAVG